MRTASNVKRTEFFYMGRSNNSGRNKRAPVVEALEPRVLYSADTLSAFALLLNDSNPESDPAPVAEFAVPDEAGSSNDVVQELVFIDSRVPEVQSIVDDITEAKGESVLIVVVDHDQNGLELIQQTLSDYSQIDSVHIVSHSLGDGVRVGTDIINERSLLAQQALFNSWGESLSANADILLYGCDLAATTDGQAVIKELAVLTQADVAASDDFTGDKNKSGDWALEYKTGAIETQDLLSAELQDTWAYILNTWDGTTLSIDSLNDKFSIAAGRYDSVDALIAHASNSADPVEQVISLREAIYAANNDPALPADFTIKLVTPGTYLLTIDGLDDNLSISDDLDIIQNMKIEGLGSTGPSKTTIQADAAFVDTNGLSSEQKRVIDVHGDITVELSGIEIKGGRIADAGGGLRVFDGLLTLDDVVVIDNRTVANGGGGIYSTKAFIVINDSVIKDNHAGTFGGGVGAGFESVLELSNVEINHNHAGTEGGGLYLQSTTVIDNGSRILLNEAVDGAGVYLAHPSVKADIFNTSIESNVALNNAGGIYVAAGTVELGSGSIVDNNRANNHAGGIFVSGVLQADSTVISNNISTNGHGGGIHTVGTAQLNDVHLYSNRADGTGTNGNGGGIYVNGTLVINNSSLHDNKANDGGGIYYLSTSPGAKIENTTLFENEASLDGGGVVVKSGVNLEIINATIANNVAVAGNNGAVDVDNGSVKISNSIVMANSAIGGSISNQLAMGVVSEGFNLISDGNRETLFAQHYTDIIYRSTHNYVVQANLATALSNDGNSTAQHLRLQAGSDAIDAGSGSYRKDGYGITGNEYADIGAVEYQATSVSQKVYFVDENENAIYRMNEDGRAVQKIVESGAKPYQYLDIAYDSKSQHLFAIRYLDEPVGLDDEYAIVYYRNDGTEINGSVLLTAGENFVPGIFNDFQASTVALSVAESIDPSQPNTLFFAQHNVATNIPLIYSVDIDYTVDANRQATINSDIWVDYTTVYFDINSTLRRISSLDAAFDPANPDDYFVVVANQAPDSSPDFVGFKVVSNVMTPYPINVDVNGSPAANNTIRSTAYDPGAEKVYFALNNLVIRAPVGQNFESSIGYFRSNFNVGFDDILFDSSNDRVWFVDKNGYIGHTDADLNLNAQPLQPNSVGATYAPVSITLASVSAVNTPPRVVNNTGLSIDENDINVPLNAASLSSTDQKSDGTTTASQHIVYTIVEKPHPLHGELTLNGVSLDNGDTFTQADLANSGSVQYHHFGGEESSDQFVFSVSDGEDGSDDIEGTFLINIAPVNDSPVLTTTFDAGSVLEDSVSGTVLASVTLSDADGTAPYTVYAMQSDGLTPSTEVSVVDNGDSTYSVLLDTQLDYESYASNPAEINFVLFAKDANNATSTLPFTIGVDDVNELPETSFPVLQAGDATETVLYTYTIPENTFTDPEGAPIIYKVDEDQLPAWLTYTEGSGVGADTGTFMGTPSHTDVQNPPLEVWVRATDGQGTSLEYTRLIINLVNINQLPQADLPVIDGGVATELEPFNFTIPANTFSDPDGDPFVYEVDPLTLPTWLTYTPGSGLGGDTGYFSGTPDHTAVQAGSVSIDVYANDGSGSWSTEKAVVTIALVDVNQRPQTSTPTLQADDATELVPYTYQIPAGTFTDPDGDSVTYKVDPLVLPAWLNFDEASRTFSGTPNHNDILPGQVNIRVTASDGLLDSNDDTIITINLHDVNQLPYAPNATILGGNVIEAQFYHYTIPFNTFIDPDGDVLTFSIDPATLPAWLTFTPGVNPGDTGSFSGTPSHADVQAGNVAITIFAVDGENQISDSTQLLIGLNDINQLPQRQVPTLQAADATELVPYTYTVPSGTFTDPDGDPVTYTVDAQTLPAWLSYDEASRTFSGTPSHADVQGPPLQIWVGASDGTGTASDFTVVTINLVDVNQLPQATNPSIQGGAATELVPYSYTIPAGTFTDPDGDVLTYSVDPATMPAWLTFTPGANPGDTGSFSGTPSHADVQAGNVAITIYAVDGASQINDSTQLLISLNDINQLPQRQVPTLQAADATELVPYTYTIPSGTFTDPDGDPVTYTVDAQTLPAWLSYDEASRTFSGTPSHADVQGPPLKIWVGASDGTGTASDFTVVTINLVDVNQLPQATNPTIQGGAATELVPYSYTIPAGTFTDPDGDVLTYSVDPATMPAWLTFTPGANPGDTGSFSGTPSHADVQDGNVGITIYATDGDNQINESTQLIINLNDVNQLPQTAYPTLSGGDATEAELYTYTIPENTFTDPDGEPIKYEVQEALLPSWLTYIQGSGVGTDTGTFVGTPSHDDVQGDPVNVWIRANDSSGTSSDFTVLTINLVDINQLPVATVTNVQAHDATELDEYTFQIPSTTFVDFDSDQLTYVVDTATMPDWLTFNQADGVFSGTPQHGDVTASPEQISVAVFDGTDTSVETVLVNINVLDINQLPTPAITSLQADDATELSAYTYQLPPTLFTDPDSDDLTYVVDQSSLPAWLSYSPNTNTFTGTPQQSDVSSTPVQISVLAFDGTGDSAGDVTILLNVNDINQLPESTANDIEAQTATETLPYTFQIPQSLFVDPDGDSLTLVVDPTTLPSWLTYNQSTATFSGVPTDADSNNGQPFSIEVQAFDGVESSSTVFIKIPVANVNQNPSDIALSSNNLVELTPGAVVGPLSTADPDAADLIHTYQVVGDDRFEIIGDTLQLKPTAIVDIDDADSITLTVQSQDEFGGTVTETLDLQVVNLNEPPVISSPVLQPTLTPGDSLDLSVLSFVDPDENDTVDYDIKLSNGDPLPQWIVLDKVAQTLTFLSAPEGTDNIELLIIVNDAQGELAEQPLFITIENAPDLGAAFVEEEPVVIVEPEPTAEPVVIIEQAIPQEQPVTEPEAIEQEIEIERVVSNEEAENEIDLSSLIQPLETIELIELDRIDSDINSITRNIVVSNDDQFVGLDITLDLDAAFSQESDVQFNDIASEFDRQREELKEQAANSKTLIGSSFTISSGLSVGYLLWLIRGGTLMGSVLSSLPAWRLVDPLPVLSSLGDDLDGDDESLESMVSKDDKSDTPASEDQQDS